MTGAPLLEWVAPPPPYPADIPADVCRQFETLAHDLVDRGFARYSADAILHRIRWEAHVERGDRAFRVNNNWAAPLARWFIARNAWAKKFFELRERISE